MKSSPLSIMLVVLLAAPAIRSQQGHGQSKLRRTVSQLQSEIEALQKSQQEMAEEIKALKELIGSGPPKPTNAAAFTTHWRARASYRSSTIRDLLSGQSMWKAKFTTRSGQKYKGFSNDAPRSFVLFGAVAWSVKRLKEALTSKVGRHSVGGAVRHREVPQTGKS